MKILIVSGRDVHELLRYDECTEVLRAALAARARGEVYQPLRTMIQPEQPAGLMALMPAYWPGTDPAYGLKAAGAHINAVGACLPHTRELDSATMADAALFADSRESVRGEAGDYLLALAEGAIGPGHAAPRSASC
jgi:ornithine cyclodeaminase/alanine dehydrogenase-like protein (mu-crystallin family)